MIMNTEYDVYFYEAFTEEEHALRKHLPENIKAGFTWKTIQESDHQSPPSAIISTRTQSIFPLEWAEFLKAVLSRSTGYDHLLEYREKSSAKAEMGYLPLYCNRAVAEQALLLWISLLRRLPLQTAQFNEFARDGLTGSELGGKKLVVYGVGNIGKEVYNIAQALNMDVYGVDIEKRHNDVKYISPEQGAEIADVIVSAMNLTTLNYGYFNKTFFNRAKKGVVFVNISRGELSPSDVLLEFVKLGVIGAVGLDVFENEKDLSGLLRSKVESDKSSVLAIKEMMKMPNVILTPHNAFNTLEAVERKSAQSIEQLNFFLENNRFKWSV